ncbi:MAG: hypothetical protein ACOYN4_19515 [Bacteroidales bacterium]
MKINRDNYEAYFLDYHEGQLSPEMVNEVLWFVENNPDVQDIFNEFEVVSLVNEPSIVFDKKSALKKNDIYATSSIHELNYDEFLISEAEGLLSNEQLQSLNEFIALNPALAKERMLYSLAHLEPENEIVFENKESLKKLAIPVGEINADTYEDFMARELEGELNGAEKLRLAEFMLYNPHLERDRELYRHTILPLEKDLVFPYKNKLKQSKTPIRRIVYYAVSVAASLTLLVSVYLAYNKIETPKSIAVQGKAIVAEKPANQMPDKQMAINTPKIPMATLPKNTVAPTQVSGNAKVVSTIESPDFSERIPVGTLTTKPARKITTRQFVDPQFTFIRSSQMYMNSHLELYYNLKLSEEMQYAQLNATDETPAKTILGAASEKADKLFAFKRETPHQEEKKNLTGWTFAELGVQTFNTLTSSDLQLNLHKDENGKVVAYGLENSLIDFEREVKK